LREELDDIPIETALLEDTSDLPRTNVRQLTTVILEERTDGSWLATQTGVLVEGYGETVADAVVDYLRILLEAGDE
jgi:hypothetical protein